MMFKFKIFLFSLFIISSSSLFASLQALSKEESSLIKSLDSQGFRIDDGNLIVLNDVASKNNLPEDSTYRLAFSCVHKKKKDTCKISGLGILPVTKP